MKKADKHRKVNLIAFKAIKILIEFCMKEKMQNPKIEINVDVQNSTEKYKLTFERTDLD